MVVAAGLLSIGAMAQSRPGIIVSAGYQGANVNVKAGDKTSEVGNKMKSGARVGVALDIPVYNFGAGTLSIQPGLYYSMKGTKNETSVTLLGKTNTSTATTTLGYIEMPILANVSFGVGNDLSVFLNAGPYLAYGVNSSYRIKNAGIVNADSEEQTTNLFKKDASGKSPRKPFDAGLQIGAGVEYSRVQLGLGYQLGLVNMSNSDNVKMTNSSFFVTVGYRF